MAPISKARGSLPEGALKVVWGREQDTIAQINIIITEVYMKVKGLKI